MDFDCIFQKICLIVFYRYSFERSCWWQIVDMPKYAKEIVIRVFLKNSWPENRVFMATINQMKKRHAIINQEINTETNQMKDWTRKQNKGTSSNCFIGDVRNLQRFSVPSMHSRNGMSSSAVVTVLWQMQSLTVLPTTAIE